MPRSFDPAESGYVDVAARLAEWYAKHPDARIETAAIEMNDDRVTVRAQVFRDSGVDTLPAGTGHSWLEIPGSTPYTRGSELENAETSAVGRALVMAGIPSKSVASADEVASKKGGEEATSEDGVIGPYERTGAIAIKANGPADGHRRVGVKTGEPFLIFAFDAGGGKTIPQVLAQGQLATDIYDAIGQDPRRLHGAPATVSGTLQAVAWKKGGRTMRPYQQLVLSRLVVEGPDGFDLPAPVAVADQVPEPVPVAPGQEELPIKLGAEETARTWDALDSL